MIFPKIILGLIVLTIVVLVHEGGHYIAAILCKVRVHTFSIGFGKKIWGFRKGETDFRLSLIPLGGYCRFYGEDSFKTALEQGHESITVKEDGEFYSSAAWKRIIITLAGPLANILFSIFVMTVIYLIGFQQQYTEPRIILASEYSNQTWPADIAGLQSGDIIISVNKRSITQFNQLRQELVYSPQKKIELGFQRNGNIQYTTITPILDKENGYAIIGVHNWIDPVIANIEKDSPSDGIFMANDRILSIDGREVNNTVDFYNLIKDINGTVKVEVERGGREITLNWSVPEQSSTGLIFEYLEGRTEYIGIRKSLMSGITETWDTFNSTIKGFRMLFMGINLQSAVAGPARLISDTGATAFEGFSIGFGTGLRLFFQIVSLISVSLAFLNLLPIPVLDGGQILLFTVEIMIRHPLKPKTIYRYQVIGTIIILIIALMATTSDLLHFRNN